MDALIPIIAAPLMAEALKVWGAFAIALMLLGVMWWLAERRCKAKDGEIATLRAEVSDLQKLRLQDAQQMIRVTETGTSTMAARAQGDQRFADSFATFADTVRTLGKR